MRTIKEILEDINSRTSRRSSKFYKPLEDIDERKLLYDHYRTELTIPENGSNMIVVNDIGTILSRGYKRIVIGDYGAYIEFTNEQVVRENIVPKWKGFPGRPVKYIWLQSKDKSKTKVYLQRNRVTYADYTPGCFYVSPGDIKLQEHE